MAGEFVPVVMLPRFATFAGTGDFATIAMEVSEYQATVLSAWRGVPVAGSPTFGMYFEESIDQLYWSDCTVTASSGTGPGWDPTSETQYTIKLTKRWFRVRVNLNGAPAVVSCWAVGFLEARER